MSLPDDQRGRAYRGHQIRPEYREFLKENRVRTALWRDEAFPTWKLVVSLCRRIKSLEKPDA